MPLTSQAVVGLDLSDLTYWSNAIQNFFPSIPNWHCKISYSVVPSFTNIPCFWPKQNTALSKMLPWQKGSNASGVNICLVAHSKRTCSTDSLQALHLGHYCDLPLLMKCYSILFSYYMYSGSSVIRTLVIRILDYPNWVSRTIIIFIFNQHV